MTPSKPITIYLCEDDGKLRRMLARMLDAQEDMQVTGQAGDAESALEDLARATDLQVLLLDLELPNMSGLELLEHLGDRTSRLDVLVLTSFADSNAVFEAMRRGAAGYVVKTAGMASILTAIRDVAAGGTVIDPQLARRFWNLFQANIGRAPQDPYGLDDKEREVLDLLAKGLTNPEVGETIGITRRSVKVLLESIYKKMGVSNRVEAVVAAVKAGIVRP